MKRFLSTFSTTDVRNIIAILFITGCMFFMGMLLWKQIPETNKNLVNIIFGNVIGFMGMVLSYFFGSAKTEKTTEKTTEKVS